MIRFILIGKNPSFTSTKNKTKLEYISEGQLSPLELAFGVELGLKSHYKESKTTLRGGCCGGSAWVVTKVLWRG